MRWPASVERIRNPSQREVRLIRVFILLATVLLVGFACWLFQPDHWGDPWLAWPLNIAFGLLFFGLLGEWWYYWRVKVPEVRQSSRSYTVDVFTTACPGEPVGMIVRTLEAMAKIEHPHNSYLCDEGDDPFLKQKCEELGVIHVTREKKVNAKAGNINNALAQSDGEICIILDPDHEPAPYMIDRLLGYFDDESIGFVQSIQAYRNQDSTIVARGAAEMQYHFYGPIQMGMHGAGTPQAIGANCAFRRTALDEIGGHAAGLAEDMHTTMRLYAAGWKGAYVPEILTRGLVPQTLGAFYKQQVKWSCGVFDLFYQVLPGVFRSLSWSQRFHFSFCPMFFLQGWITLFGALVPILCLLTGGVAWKISSGPFLWVGCSLLALVLLIRMIVQRFLAEPSERGFHLTSGILCAGTWWPFIVGNLCALFRRKVPYIPTPKDDLPENAWRISIPNLLLGGLSLASIPIGLRLDYSPYSLLMAVFAAWNAVSLLAVVAMSQQKTNRRLKRWCTDRLAAPLVEAGTEFGDFIRRQSLRLHHGVLSLLRERPIGVMAGLAILIGGMSLMKTKSDQDLAMAWAHLVRDEKEIGGFYSGFYSPTEFTNPEPLATGMESAEAQLGRSFDIPSLYVAWGPDSLTDFPRSQLEKWVGEGRIPMITWEPWTETFPWAHEQGHYLAQNKGIMHHIAEGDFDYYIEAFARKLRDLQGPVFLRFAHEMDNPHYPWSEDGKVDPDTFVHAWRRMVNICQQQGASNVVFVYNPWRGDALGKYYPGDDAVDWIGLTLLNYGKASGDGEWYDFESLYGEFHHHVLAYDKPVMLAEFGSTGYGGDAEVWLGDAFRKIEADHPEIRGVVMFETGEDRNWATEWRPEPGAPGIDWRVLDDSGSRNAVRKGLASLQDGAKRREPLAEVSSIRGGELPAEAPTALSGSRGSYELKVDGEPFYVRGVAYNPGHDWRDGTRALSRREIDKDFAALRDMGANTVRRYSSGWVDYNLFNAAEDAGLKVLYGLWLPPDIDYSRDTDALEQFEREFDEVIERFKDEPSLLAWVVGNEVWGTLKHSFEQPYLAEVRCAYVRFVERIARKIREVDPHRPIMVVCEHSDELPGALTHYVNLAPTVDMLGVNTYFPEHLRELPDVVAEFGAGLPYMVTEFGPDGYWHHEFTPRGPEGMLLEPTAREKARMYAERWDSFILPERGKNLGGVAYCWSDRYEASASWFGLVASDGTPKPAYAALKEAWTGVPAPDNTGPEIERLIVSEKVVSPGEVIRAEAVVETGSQGRATDFSWQVIDGRYKRSRVDVEPVKPGGRTVELTAPSDGGRYWIHFSATDSTGGFDEVAVEIRVKEDERTDKSKAPALSATMLSGEGDSGIRFPPARKEP